MKILMFILDSGFNAVGSMCIFIAGVLLFTKFFNCDDGPPEFNSKEDEKKWKENRVKYAPLRNKLGKFKYVVYLVAFAWIIKFFIELNF